MSLITVWKKVRSLAIANDPHAESDGSYHVGTATWPIEHGTALPQIKELRFETIDSQTPTDAARASQ